MLRSKGRRLIPLSMAAILGVFLAIASEALNWPSTTTFVVGCALAAVLALLGTPLLLMDFSRLETTPADGHLPGNPKVAVRGELAREFAVQVRGLVDQQQAFDAPTAKTQNFDPPLFWAMMLQHDLHVQNRASESDLLGELIEKRHLAAYVNARGDQSRAYSRPVADLPELEHAGGHETRHEPETLGTAGLVTHRNSQEQIQDRLEPWILQPTLKVAQ